MKTSKAKTPKYYLTKEGSFVIEEYNYAKPFANFFPGIAGKYGIPMWVFYVNRGQGIISFGTKDKDHSIMEFFPANKAWQYATSRGFRTFIKIAGGKSQTYYEPFHNGIANLQYDLSNKMSFDSCELSLLENNSTLGLEVSVNYFNIPQERFAALVRTLTIKNTSRKTRAMQLLDGIPQIIPYATANWFLKKMSRTIEAWMGIKNLENKVPFFKLDVDPADRPEVCYVNGGNFYLGFHCEYSRPQILKPIVDPENIFGTVSDFSFPAEFLAQKKFSLPKEEITKSKTPSAFSLLDFTLKPGETKTLYSVIGYMPNLETLNATIERIASNEYLNKKREENRAVILSLQSEIETKSSSKAFDLYSKQTYLDNIMRGGYPVIFNSKPSSSVFYLYSRKHGDLERDYNNYSLEATYFSQGNGNYRDANQNHRSDIWFNPEIRDENIIAFFNLLQLDGFNPLVVKGATFSFNCAAEAKKVLSRLVGEENLDTLCEKLSKPFTPGEIMSFLEEQEIDLSCSNDDFLNALLSFSHKNYEAEHGEGFWTDHWTYNLDLLTNYFAIFPEDFKAIVFNKKIFTYYDNFEVVKPRSLKHLLLHNIPRQLQSVSADPKKLEMINSRSSLPHVVRDNFGQGQIYRTTLISKLLCLFTNKMSSLDPSGCGIEMEANKPNWYDALNGLPGIFGSSLCETFELKRLILFIKECLARAEIKEISLTEEVNEFLAGLGSLLKEANDDFSYWNSSYELKEAFREKIKFGVSGQESKLKTQDLTDILDLALQKIDAGIAKVAQGGIYYSYFINQVTDFEKLSSEFIRAKGFKQVLLPLFLEGQVHALRLSPSQQEAKQIYQATKNSPLFDSKLKMYKVTASLKDCPKEIGRCTAFAPGWLEHESIWLHMEYKYLLELLKKGLYTEFYEDFKNVLVPFQDPKRYGRSILENSSFIVSSAFLDKRLHGNGYVARLSGSTAEFIEMWLVMNAGEKPFFLNLKGELNARLSPLLAGWLFDKAGNYSFNFLSRTKVTYHNPKKKDTFGASGARIRRMTVTETSKKIHEISGDTLPSQLAERLRSRRIASIEAYLS